MPDIEVHCPSLEPRMRQSTHEAAKQAAKPSRLPRPRATAVTPPSRERRREKSDERVRKRVDVAVHGGHEGAVAESVEGRRASKNPLRIRQLDAVDATRHPKMRPREEPRHVENDLPVLHRPFVAQESRSG